MVINTTNDQSIELKIVNYQFPELYGKEWDSNWLLIFIKVNCLLGNWQTTDSILTTWEVRDLIDWFNNLSQNIKPKWKDQEFTEPNVSFYLLNDFQSLKKLIRIKFNNETRPESASDNIEYFIDFEADSNDLKKLASDLEAELEKFPAR